MVRGQHLLDDDVVNDLVDDVIEDHDCVFGVGHGKKRKSWASHLNTYASGRSSTASCRLIEYTALTTNTVL